MEADISTANEGEQTSYRSLLIRLALSWHKAVLPSRQQLHEWCVGRTTSLPEILVHQLIVQQGKRTPWSTAVQMEDNKTFPTKFYCVRFGKQKMYVSCLLSTMSIHDLSILEANK